LLVAVESSRNTAKRDQITIFAGLQWIDRINRSTTVDESVA